MRILGSGWYEDDVTGLHRQHFPGHAECSFSFKDDEHLFLRVMKMIWTPPLAGGECVDRCAELPRGGASRRARTMSIVVSLPQHVGQRNLVEVAYESSGEGGGAVGHGDSGGKGPIANATTVPFTSTTQP